MDNTIRLWDSKKMDKEDGTINVLESPDNSELSCMCFRFSEGASVAVDKLWCVEQSPEDVFAG